MVVVGAVRRELCRQHAAANCATPCVPSTTLLRRLGFESVEKEGGREGGNWIRANSSTTTCVREYGVVVMVIVVVLLIIVVA